MKRFLFLACFALFVCFSLFAADKVEKTKALPSQTSGKSDNAMFGTPEALMATYIEALRKGDRVLANKCFAGGDFQLDGPVKIKKYKITKKQVFGKKEVDDWNEKGTVPPAQIGDVNLEVDQDGEMFSYFLRHVTKEKWQISAHYAWNAPD
ncbi:MAG: hypothetical protein V1798_01345 [Pseudomonadota bacterium]